MAPTKKTRTVLRNKKSFEPKKSENKVPQTENQANARTYTIRDYRLERPNFSLRQVRVGDEVRYEVESGDLSAPAPPLRDSKYLDSASSSSKSIAGCSSTAAWKRLSKIYTSKARLSAASTSALGRKPAPAPPPTLCTKTNGLAP